MAETSLTLVSEPGDPIGNGGTYQYDASSGSFSVNRNYRQGISLAFSGPVYWYIDLAAPGNAPLSVGTYPDAIGFSSGSDRAGMSVNGSYGYCSEQRGIFRIKHVVYSGDQISACWFVFEDRCSYGSGAMRGEFRYNLSPNIIAVYAPLERRITSGGSTTVGVTATGSGTEPIGISALNVPDGASFSYDGQRGASLTWAPSPTQVGRHRITFVADDSLGHRDSTTTDLVVAGENALQMVSEPGDPVGSGFIYSYSDSAQYQTRTNSSGGVGFEVGYPFAQGWSLDFASGTGAPLEVGFYDDVVRYQTPGTTNPQLFVSRGSYCERISGNFQVKQLVYGTGGLVESFWAVFQQTCGTASGALIGELRYNARVQVEMVAPPKQVAVRGELLDFGVSASAAAGLVSITMTDAPPGAELVAGPSGTTASFHWTPGFNDIGRYRVVFHARDAIGNEDSTATYISITGVTSFTVASESGQPIGFGVNTTYRPSNARFTGFVSTFTNATVMTVEAIGFNDTWSLSFASLSGLVTPGFYPSFQRLPTATAGGLDITHSSNNCSAGTGAFYVKQAVYGPGNVLESFWVVFEHHCNGNPSPLLGDLRYNADVRAIVTAPLQRRVQRESVVEFTVNGASIVPGPVSLEAASLPSGASFTDHGNGSGTFHWQPGVESAGSNSAVFLVRDSQGNVDSTGTEILVTGLTSVAIDSETGDYVGGGKSYFYPGDSNTITISEYSFNYGITAVVSEGRFGDRWEFTFTPPIGQALDVGIYENVLDVADATHAGLRVNHQQYYSCSGEGRFRILQLVRGPNQTVESFWATFDLRCLSASGWLRGEIRYNADVRLPFAVPTDIEGERGELLAIGVKATDFGGRRVTLAATGLPDGATFEDQGDDTGILEWTPGWDQFGDHVVTFIADNQAGGVAVGRSRLRVVGATSMRLTGTPGEPLTGGRTIEYRRNPGTFVLSSNNYSLPTIYASSPGDTTWTLTFAASDSGRLQVGNYYDARLVPTHTRPAMLVQPLSQYYYPYPDTVFVSCTETRGDFRVKHVVYDDVGRLTSLWTEFEQHCNDSPAALTGELRFNADVVVAVHAPLRAVVRPGEQLTFDVQAENLAGGPTPLTTSPLPNGAHFTDHGDRTGTFEWMPETTGNGIYPITFYATGPLGRVDSTVTLVRVAGLSVITLHSDLGDPVGEGLDTTYDEADGLIEAERNSANGVSVRFRSHDLAHEWNFDFAAPDQGPLTTGTYSPVMRYPFQERGRGGLDVRADERHCSTLIGNFTVHEIRYGPAGEIAHFSVTFTQRCNGAGPALQGSVMFHADATTAVLASFVESDVRDGVAWLTWAAQPSQRAAIERRTEREAWHEVGRVTADGVGRIVYADGDVRPGSRYGYRIVILDSGVSAPLAEHWIDVPLRAGLALGRPYPNPTFGDVSISFELPDARAAKLELLDVAGRRVSSMEIGSLGAGLHRVALPASSRLPAGVYTIRLVREGRSLVTPVCVTR